MSEKTEKPTPKKLRDSRKKGQVGQSQDVPKLLIVAALCEVILAMVDNGMEKMQALVSTPISLFNQPFGYAVKAVAVHCFTIAGSLMILVLGIAVMMRLAGAWLQFGFLFAPEALKLDPNRLNPANQLKNMFSGKKLFELFNSLLKAIALGVLIYYLLYHALSTLLKLPQVNLAISWQVIAHLFNKIERACLVVLLVLAGIDFGIQKYFYLKGLKMSKEDIKNEFKSSEGDPHTKSHRRSEARRLANEEPKKAKKAPTLDDADMLVVNPTHFAVALYYRAEVTPLPRITVKGRDEDALNLIEQAKKKEIPVIRFIWLARTLYKEEEGSFIPRETLRYVGKIYQVLHKFDTDDINDANQHIEDI